MPKPFNPPLPEKELTIVVTAREAHLIKILRKYPFGKILVHKTDGRVVRAEPNQTVLIEEKEGLDMGIGGRGEMV